MTIKTKDMEQMIKTRLNSERNLQIMKERKMNYSNNKVNQDYFQVHKDVPIPNPYEHRRKVSKHARMIEVVRSMELGDMISLESNAQVHVARKAINEDGLRAVVRKGDHGFMLWKMPPVQGRVHHGE